VFSSLFAFSGCKLHEKVLHREVDEQSGKILLAEVRKTRPGLEGWDFVISVKSHSGSEIARSTVTSLDSPDDVGTEELAISGLVLDSKTQKVTVAFKNGKKIAVPVVLWLEGEVF